MNFIHLSRNAFSFGNFNISLKLPCLRGEALVCTEITISTLYISLVSYTCEYSAPSNNPRTLILGEEIIKNNENGFNLSFIYKKLSLHNNWLEN